MARRVALCADDYGYNAAVDEAILALIDLGRLGGTSCMVDAPRFSAAAPPLRERASRADIGLHFNLTEAFPGAPRIGSLPKVIAFSWLQALQPVDVVRRLKAQLARFEAAFKCIPAYIDGHQHVHQFPLIRDALLGELAARYGSRRPLIRNTVSTAGDGKLHLLALLGGRSLRTQLNGCGWPTNLDFVGAYRYAPGVDFATLAAKWLRTLKDGAIWMCHPATRAEPNDPIGAFRVAEYRWLASDEFDPQRLPASIECVRPSGLLRAAA
ncbi:MAG: ChbG/HpnK family deacetylase [Gemmatimonadota bacterium]